MKHFILLTELQRKGKGKSHRANRTPEGATITTRQAEHKRDTARCNCSAEVSTSRQRQPSHQMHGCHCPHCLQSDGTGPPLAARALEERAKAGGEQKRDLQLALIFLALL